MLSSYRALRHYPNLTTLSLMYCSRLDIDALQTDSSLAEVFRALPDLQHLSFYRVPMAMQEVPSLLGAPTSPSTPSIPILQLRDLHLATNPNQLSALLRHI